MKIFCCDDWEQGIAKLDAPLVTQFIRTGIKYEGKPFKFCPWCGQEIDKKSIPMVSEE